MKQIFTHVFMAVLLVWGALSVNAQQLPDPGFEDWSGTKFDGNIQPKYWHGSNVSQVGFNFNFTERATGRSGYCVMVQDREVGAFGITETGPGYFGLGTAWQYLSGINTGTATAGMSGGISFTYRPDTMAVWIKRTGTNWSKEDFHLLFYTWKGTAKGNAYKNKNGGCASTSQTDEESDIRQALDGNECGTATKATQVAEGWVRDRKEYTNWTLVKVPIYYANDEVPQKCNVIFSAGNYPNFRANSGLYDGNALYVDDVQLIYSSKIQHLYIGGKEWKGFDPNSSEEQTYSVGRTTVVPEIYATRGEGSLTNTKNNTVTFAGRKLSGSEISISYGQVDGAPTVITVKAEDGSSTTTYKIKMVQEPSDNPRLNNILVNGQPVAGFNGYVGTYNVALPYGTTAAPVVEYVLAEDGQTATITQATSPTGTATISVTAPDNKTKMTYTLKFSVALLADNTLQAIKVNGEELAEFIPTLTTYRVELPLGTTTMPAVEAVSAYPAGEQTITYKAPTQIDGGQYQVSVTTPGNQTAKVYKLNFKITASSNSKLKDLQMGDYILFNPNNQTYYVNLPMGTSALPQITYEQGDQWQTVAIEDGGVNGTTRVVVTAANGDQTIYKIICSTEKSDVSYLNNIYLDGVALDGFAPNTYRYTVSMPTGTTTIPQITYEQGDEYETVQVNYGGINATTRIFVTADDGSTSLYEIVFSVSLADVSTLDMISVGGEPLDGFSPAQTDYTISLPQGTTTLPEVTYLTHDEWQTVTVRSNGVNGDYKITVRSQAGTTTTYVLHFSVSTSSNTTLAAVYFGGTAYAEFDPAVREYDVTLAEGVSQVPAVTFDKGDESQKIVATLEGTTYTIRVIAENGTSAAYIFRFTIQKSENAFLDMIYLDGVELADFSKQNLVYNVVLTSTTCPAISVDKDPTQQVTITAPASTGEARIVVTPESGAPNTYIINFTSSLLPELSAIYADGVRLSDYNPAQHDYEVLYTKAVPTITFDKVAEEQNVTMVNSASGVRLYVEAGSEKAVYTITFVQSLATDATLRSISADGVQLPDFSSTQFAYTYALTGDSYPIITYERNDAEQHVTAGLSSQYVYSIVVTAASGNSQTYDIRFTTGASSNTTLAAVLLADEDVTALFDEDNNLSRTIDKGADLPTLTYTTQDGQSVVAAQTGALQQQMTVIAEDGSSAVYTINYTERTETNALLKDIRMYVGEEWQQVAGFDKNTFAYSVTLPWRSTTAPCLWTISDRPHQVVTISYGAANGTTTLHVVAEDGQEQDYTITFAVSKSGNNKLGSLTIDGDEQDVNETDYTFTMPFGSTEGYEVQYEKAEPEQLIEFVSAPIDGVTKIIVTAENGDMRTYSIRYNVAQPTGENIVRSVAYSYTDKDGEEHEGSLVPVKGNNVIELPYGSKSFSVTAVEKNYAEQAVVFYNGGIRRGATIIATANRTGEADVTYTITPKMPEFDTTGKLSDLQFNGATVPNFRPDVYNYMVNVTAEPTAADFTYTAYNDAEVTPSSIDAKNKQITFAVESGETYSVCWYYENDIPPFKFNWISTKASQFYSFNTIGRRSNNGTKSVGIKPEYWMVPADYTSGCTYNAVVTTMGYDAGMEVISGGETGVILNSVRGAALNGSMPGVLTLGSMSINLQVDGNTAVTVNRTAGLGYNFRNTPDRFEVDYLPISNTNISSWNGWITVSNGTTQRVKAFSGNLTNHTWQTSGVDLDYGTLVMSKFNMAIASDAMSNTTSGSTSTSCTISVHGGSSIYTSSLQLRDLRFIYNSELTAATADGEAMTKNGNTFTLDVDENYVGIPALKFTGKVHDQMQTIEWLNNGEWIDGKLTAKVTNYGENSEDNTVYTVVLQRSAVTSLAYTASFGTYGTTVSNDTTYVDMPYGTTALPDFDITPANIHQHFAIEKNGNTTKVTVTAEDGTSKTNVYVFRAAKTSQATLDAITGASLTPVFNPETADYTVTAATMPALTYIKGDEDALHQTVDMKEENGKVTFVVTSEDGTAQQTYTVTLNPTTETTNGKLIGINRNGADLTTFAQETYAYTERAVENVAFAREYAADAVVETITDDSLTVALTGTDEEHTYTITYPTEQSANADLGGVLINGDEYDEFNPVQTDYTYESDEPIDIRFLLSEDAQTIAISLSSAASAPAVSRVSAARTAVSIFTVVVTAENGSQKTYTFTIRPESSDEAALAGISVNGVAISDFYPDKLQYTYTIPTTSPKQAEPNLPDVGYTLGQESQSVSVEPATTLGGTTILTVTAENGTTVREYELTINAEPSHSAELQNILVNGEPISGFRSARTYYSIQVFGDEVNVDYATADRFQTVVVSDTENDGKLLTVTAQDGTTVREYEIEVWRAAQSNNANLADILLNGQSLTDYAEEHNINIDPFNEKTYTYHIPMQKGAQIPDISATLQEDAQTIEILTANLTKTIRVTAEDGVTVNDYRLLFEMEESSNTALQDILINGDALSEFSATQYVYTVALPIGVRTLPSVDFIKQEAEQAVVVTSNDMRTLIQVTAEDGSQATYSVLFAYTYSDADTLMGIYADGALIEGFASDAFYYAYVLPQGVRTLPVLDYEPADQYETVAVDTIQSGMTTTYRYTVLSESGKKNLYTVIYEIQRSNTDTLQSLMLDGKPMQEFVPLQNDYLVSLPAGTATMPVVTYVEGDDYEQVEVRANEGYTQVVVTAENGQQRVYTIRFEVERSANTALLTIGVDGAPLNGFDEDKLTYTVTLPYGTTSVPNVTFSKAEDAQNVTLGKDGMTVTLTVVAANGTDTRTYEVTFVEGLSSNAALATLAVDGEAVAEFDAATYEYQLTYAYDATTLPEVSFTLADETAVADTAWTDNTLTIETTAADGTMLEYILVFTQELSPVDWLSNILVKGESLEGFHADTLVYVIGYPVGTTEAEMLHVADIEPVKADEGETIDVQEQDGTITLLVTAPNGSIRVYVIRQKIALNSNSLLSNIMLNGSDYVEFSDSVFNYEYLLLEGELVPAIDAIPQDSMAEVSITYGNVDEPTYIYCTAQDGSETVYTIRFVLSTINTAQTPSGTDVLIKHVAGTNTFKAYSIRMNTWLAVYDHVGNLLLNVHLPLCNPNAAVVVSDVFGREVLTDAFGDGVEFTIPSQEQVYFYLFYTSDKRISSGKIVLP